MSAWASLLRRALHALIPVECTACGASLGDDPVPFFCRGCWARIRPLHGPRCPRCGRPFASTIALTYSPTHRCGDCRRRPPAYSMAWSGYAYESPLREAIHLFKFRGKVALADPLGELLCDACREPPEVDLLMPVPLHSARLREREFNQSLLLADRLARRLHLPVVYGDLVRVRQTPPQTELTKVERRSNLRRAFAVRSPARVAGRRILLVDDVMTTGATVNECAKALRRAGAEDVYVATLARTV